MTSTDELERLHTIWQMGSDDAAADASNDIMEALPELLARVRRYESIIRVLLENEPDDIVADGGHTVLDLWRHEARAALNQEPGE